MAWGWSNFDNGQIHFHDRSWFTQKIFCDIPIVPPHIVS